MANVGTGPLRIGYRPIARPGRAQASPQVSPSRIPFRRPAAPPRRTGPMRVPDSAAGCARLPRVLPMISTESPAGAVSWRPGPDSYCGRAVSMARSTRRHVLSAIGSLSPISAATTGNGKVSTAPGPPFPRAGRKSGATPGSPRVRFANRITSELWWHSRKIQWARKCMRRTSRAGREHSSCCRHPARQT